MTNAELVVQLMIALLNQAGTLSALYSKAQAENRDVSQDELDSLVFADGVARAELVIAIARRHAQEAKTA
jgi:hypothetical protein